WKRSGTEFFAGQRLQGLEVPGPGVGDDLRGQRRRRRLLVPAQGFQVIPEILFVIALLRAAGAVVLLGPEAGGVRGERLVDEEQLAVRQAEFELGVRDDDAPGFGP